MRAVSVFPWMSFCSRTGRKYMERQRPKGPFTALSPGTLFFSRNSCTIACCNLNQWCQATIPAQGDGIFPSPYMTSAKTCLRLFFW